MVNGQYEVTVSVLVNGQWSGYCGAACTLTILNTPSAEGMGQRSSDEPTGTHDMSLFPNPVAEGEVQLEIPMVNTWTGPIMIDLFDMSGKHVLARALAADGPEMFRTVLDLRGSVVSGTYLVRATVGEKVFTERLIVHLSLIHIYTVLELDGRIAAGVYLVNITMNGEMTTRLLSVM